MKSTLLNTTGALALTLLLGSGVALADQVSLDETLQYNEDSRNVEGEKGGQAANNGGRNYNKETDIKIESKNETKTETKHETKTETKTEVEAENGSQAANNGGKNVHDESFDLRIGDISVAVGTQTLAGAAAAIQVKAYNNLNTGSITHGANSMKLAAGNFAVSDNTGMGSVVQAANLQSVVGTVRLGQ